ncbi:unnamed protein product (mitochondrion) [Plasmodiophora brassicae]|uniref:Uncharacterized protein n=1 Tax=Plasmodiophora brassicae TaxID=37360 RepID=A0A3P3Y3R4_PLABS|nr:unnamed protein product [Plasmodiophora brassicae]
MAFEFVALLHVEGYKLGSVEPLAVALQFLCSVLIVISVVTVAVRIGSAPHYFKAQAIVGSLVGLAATITSAALFSVGTPELEHEWNRTPYWKQREYANQVGVWLPEDAFLADPASLQNAKALTVTTTLSIAHRFAEIASVAGVLQIMSSAMSGGGCKDRTMQIGANGRFVRLLDEDVGDNEADPAAAFIERRLQKVGL